MHNRKLNYISTFRLFKSVQIGLKPYFVRFFLLSILCIFDRMQSNKTKSYKDTHKRAILSPVLSY